ncbi:MAG: type II toxin-antitoxin system HicB family antitoxin [Desulfobulbus sp.]|nr:type II toxin-antitoxin system HicB family antitoxin [Desulfobulbus sp.]
MNYYIAVFFPAPEGGYTIMYPDIPEALSQGDDLAESMKNAAEALALVVEEYAKSRRMLPAPSGMGAVRAWAEKEKTSGGVDVSRECLFPLFAAPEVDMTPVRITVSIAKSVLETIDEKARLAGLTRSGFLVTAAQAYTADRSFHSRR